MKSQGHTVPTTGHLFETFLLAGAILLSASTCWAASSEGLRDREGTRLHAYSDQQIRTFEELDRDMHLQARDDARTQKVLRRLELATRDLKASWQEDTLRPSRFSQEQLRSDLFRAQEAAHAAVELGIANDENLVSNQ